MVGLVDKCLLFFVRQSHQRFTRHGIPRDESAPLEKVPMLRQAVLVDEMINISEQLIGRDELQGVTTRSCEYASVASSIDQPSRGSRSRG